MEPNIAELINGYEFTWTTPHELTARVTRLRVPSDGQVRGELEILHRNGNEDYILLVPTFVNFSSEPTRVKYAKQLKEKVPLQVEWKQIIDFISNEILTLARAGDEPVEVYADIDMPPPQQLLGSLIYRGVQNIIFGEKGVNKSTLAYLFGLCLALPWHDNPLSLPVPQEHIKTLVCDWETDEGVFRYYMARLQKGMDMPPCSLYYRHCTLPLVDDIEAIRKHIDKTKAQLLIIDSLGAAAGANKGALKDPETALLFNQALRKLNVTSLITAQTSKSDEDGKKKTIYGSTFFAYYARNIFELCGSEDTYSDVRHLGLIHHACNLGKRIPEIGLRIEYAEDGGIKIDREAFNTAEFVHKMSVSKMILEALKNGAMSSKDLQEHLDVSRASVDMAIKRLRSQEKIIDTGGKKWGLPVI